MTMQKSNAKKNIKIIIKMEHMALGMENKSPKTGTIISSSESKMVLVQKHFHHLICLQTAKSMPILL